MDALKKLKTYPHNAYFLLWTLVVLLLLAVFLLAMVLMSSLNTGPSLAGGVCTYSGPTTAKNGDPFKITYGGFAAGERIGIWEKFSGTMRQDLGRTLDSLSSPKTLKGTFSKLADGGYTMMIQTRFPVVNFKCADITIANVPPPPPPPPISCAYDYNKDGKVDNADVDILLKYFGQSAPAGSSLAIYDLDKSGTVDLNDALLLSAKFGSC